MKSRIVLATAASCGLTAGSLSAALQATGVLDFAQRAAVTAAAAPRPDAAVSPQPVAPGAGGAAVDDPTTSASEQDLAEASAPTDPPPTEAGVTSTDAPSQATTPTSAEQLAALRTNVNSSPTSAPTSAEPAPTEPPPQAPRTTAPRPTVPRTTVPRTTVPAPATSAAPTTTQPAAPANPYVGVELPSNWPSGVPLPPIPAGCLQPHLEDDGRWNCEH